MENAAVTFIAPTSQLEVVVITSEKMESLQLLKLIYQIVDPPSLEDR
ncbi:MAG: hypothetical protein NUK63_01100 [Candidatus Bathyarchaeum tardum]|nr:MAG: hypothetical protein NUK63_01100 [Candidatus Bathyarchaeum tardum]